MRKFWHYVGVIGLCSVASVGAAGEPLSTEGPAREASTGGAVSGFGGLFDEEVTATSYSQGCDLCNVSCQPQWTVRAGAILLQRDQPDALVLARPLGGLIQVSGGEDFDFGVAGGPDISVERRMGNSCNSIEVRYFGALDWSSRVDYGATGDIEIGPIDIPLAIDVISQYDSKLDNVEINWRHQHSDRLTVLAGFRYLRLDESLSYDVDFLVPNLSGVNWDTDNDLYGAQMGADLKLWRVGGPLSINGIFKAGIFGNSADNNFNYDVLGTPIVEGSASDTSVAFVGEMGINAAYQVTRHFAIRGGYQVLWVNEVALASDQANVQLQTSDIDAITTSGDVFYHGALVGGEFTW